MSLITKPVGLYLKAVLESDGKTFLDPVVKPFEHLTYKLLGIDPKKEQNWGQLRLSLLVFSLLTILFTYAILRSRTSFRQAKLNPQSLAALTPGPRLQHGRQLRDQHQLAVLWRGEHDVVLLPDGRPGASRTSFRPAVGLAVAAAFVRGIARRETTSSAISGSI